MTDRSAKDLAAEVLSNNGIDSDWITTALAPIAGEATVIGTDSSAIGTGQVGENVRCQLDWSDPAEHLPASVVLKLPSLDPSSRQAAAATRTYIREVGFYRDVADKVTLRIPEVYFVSENRTENSFALMMEDIHPANQGEQLQGCNPEEAEMAVESAALLHGSTWNTDWLHKLDWVDARTHAQARQGADLFTSLVPGFLSRYGDQLNPAERATCKWLQDHIDRYFSLGIESAHQSLVHGDYRLDNMLFGDQGAPPLTVVDWQTASLHSPIADLSYFIGTSVTPTQQADLLDPLLDLYHGTLSTVGVTADRSWIDQQFAALAPSGLIMAVIASQIVGQTERGDAMFMVMAKGAIHLMAVTSTASHFS